MSMGEIASEGKKRGQLLLEKIMDEHGMSCAETSKVNLH